ncbi:hypothetical protein [Luteipulveratus halotolerans]|uniref:Uncharacterized protein n=1 Tax=Luteipulveratus halotolerans TaxID=1631356 RepID=A0A0L6CKC7_9MICO|nr:hypothetical protein [Luteipulveratus halotolerans]KNX38070.1 hypothetical protein VV01_14430 [Luteipulveratus halotolerans]
MTVKTIKVQIAVTPEALRGASQALTPEVHGAAITVLEKVADLIEEDSTRTKLLASMLGGEPR